MDSIDLKYAIDVQDSSVRKFGFQIIGEKRHWTLAADSEVSQKEWLVCLHVFNKLLLLII